MQDDPCDTERLAELAREGNPEAQDALSRKSYPILARAAARQLRGRFGGLRRRLETADLAQSAYHDALRALDRWEGRGRGSFRKWLLGILRNKLRRKLAGTLAERRDPRREVALGDLDRSASSGGDPCRQILRAEDRERLLLAVNALPEKSRNVVRLRYFEGLAWRQVGENVGLSEEAAQMLCHRALRALHADFEGGSGRSGA